MGRGQALRPARLGRGPLLAGRALTAGCRGCGARRASTVMEGGSPLEPALPGLRCPPWPVAPAPRAGEEPYASCTWRPSRGGAWLSACLAPQAISLQPQVCVPRGGTAVRKPVWARLSREWRKAGWSSFTGDEGQVAGVWLPSLAAPWKAVLVSAWCRGRPGHLSFGFLHVKEDQFPFPFLF